MKPTWMITRQCYYYTNVSNQQEPVQLQVEVSYGREGWGPDAYAARPEYKKLGEFQEYHDPREAVEDAIKLQKQWILDERARGVKAAIYLTICSPGIHGGEGEPITYKDARKWAFEKWAEIETCTHCGEVIDPQDTYFPPDDEESVCCSQNCADEMYANGIELCTRQECNKEFARKDGQYHNDAYYCSDTCIELDSDSYQKVDGATSRRHAVALFADWDEAELASNNDSPDDYFFWDGSDEWEVIELDGIYYVKEV